MIYCYFYRLLMRLSHRFNWHHMKPNPHLEQGKVHLWCHWCGIKSVKTNIEELTNEEVGDFTHRMVLCCGVNPNSADINVLGLKFIVEDILRKASEK